MTNVKKKKNHILWWSYISGFRGGKQTSWSHLVIRTPSGNNAAHDTQPSINVWCSLMHDHLIRPFFYTDVTVTATSYLDMLENCLSIVIRTAACRVLLATWNSCQPNHHTSYHTLWLFLPAHKTESVHQTPVVNTKDFKNRYVAAIASVDVDMPQHTWLELDYCFNTVCVTDSNHLECATLRKNLSPENNLSLFFHKVVRIICINLHRGMWCNGKQG